MVNPVERGVKGGGGGREGGEDKDGRYGWVLRV